MTIEEKLAKAMDLLERAGSMFDELTGEHAIRTEEGWELVGGREFEPDEIEEEVNKP